MSEPSARARRTALLALMSEGFFSRLSSGAIAFALPLYARQLGMGFAEISILLLLNVIVGMALKPLAGPLVDKIGYRLSAVVAIAARGALYLLLAFAGMVWHLALIQSAGGVAKSVRDPALYSLLAKHGEEKRMASTFAWYQTAKGAAGSLGHAVAGFLLALTASNFSWVFAAAAAVAILPCLFLPVLIAERREIEPKPAEPQPCVTKQTNIPRKRKQFDLAPYIGFGFLVSTTSHMLRRMMPILLVEYAGLAEGQAGSLYLLAAMVSLLATPLFGWLYDNVSPGAVLMTRSVLNATSSLIYIVHPTYGGFTVGKILDKSGTAAFRPAWGALMAQASSVAPANRAKRIAVMSAGEDAGTICGPLVAGVLWSVFGVVPMLAVRIGFALATEVYTVFLIRWINKTKSEGAGNAELSAIGQKEEPQ